MKKCRNSNLQIFEEHELLYTKQQAWQVLVFFFGGNAKSTPIWMGNTERSFAQTLMIQALEMSAGMTWIRRIFTNMVAPSATITSLASKTVNEGAKSGWFSFIGLRFLQGQKTPVIYKSIVNSIYWKQSKIWDLRVQDLKFIYQDGGEVLETANSDPFYCNLPK